MHGKDVITDSDGPQKPDVAHWDPTHPERYLDLTRDLCGHVKLQFRSPEERLTLSTFRLGQCRVSRVIGSPTLLIGGRTTAMSAPDAIKLGIFRQGARFRQANVTRVMWPGSCVIYDPTRPYGHASWEATDQIVVHVPRHLLSPRFGPLLREPQIFGGDGLGMPRILASLLVSICDEFETLDETSRSRLGGAITQFSTDLLASRLEEASADSLGLEVLRHRAKAFIAGHIEDPSLTIASLSRAVGCSERYIYKAFEGEGVTPERYIWHARLDRARTRLAIATDQTPLSEVAYFCGFSSYAHFSRAFKARFGAAPSDFRAEALAGCGYERRGYEKTAAAH